VCEGGSSGETVRRGGQKDEDDCPPKKEFGLGKKHKALALRGEENDFSRVTSLPCLLIFPPYKKKNWTRERKCCLPRQLRGRRGPRQGRILGWTQGRDAA